MFGFNRVLAAAALLLATSSAQAAILLWEKSHRGLVLDHFDWAQDLSLDASRRRLYVAGKVTNIAGSSDMWAHGFDADNGTEAWIAPFEEHPSDAPKDGSGAAEEMYAGVASWSGGNLAVAGRYTMRTTTASVQAWAARRAILGYNGPLIQADDAQGTATQAGFAPPTRGLDTIIRPNTQTAWTVSLGSSAALSMYYSFAQYDGSGNRLSEHRFPVLGEVDADWTGDCCLDPAARMGVDAQSNLYTLLGSRYTPATGYDIVFGRLNAGGSLTPLRYNGTGNGRDVADGLVVSPEGRVFIVGKTSETGSGFGTRLLAFDAAGGLLWRVTPTFDGEALVDCVVALSPNGTLWVVESATGRGVAYSQTGSVLRQEILPLTSPGSTYIGHVVADAGDSLYVCGGALSQAWVAKYDVKDRTVVQKQNCGAAYNYPNPFKSGSSQTKLHYELPKDVAVTVTVYDLTGRTVRTWSMRSGDEGARRGVNEIAWDGTAVGQKVETGMYMASVRTQDATCQQSMRIGVFR